MNSNSNVAVTYHTMVICYISRGAGSFLNPSSIEVYVAASEYFFTVTLSFLYYIDNR